MGFKSIPESVRERVRKVAKDNPDMSRTEIGRRFGYGFTVINYILNPELNTKAKKKGNMGMNGEEMPVSDHQNTYPV